MQTPQDVSSDGTHLVYVEASRVTGFDLWLLPLAGEGTPRPHLATPAAEMTARFSPDGRWLAFASSTESGSNEVYVAAVDDARAMRSRVGGRRCPRDGVETGRSFST